MNGIPRPKALGPVKAANKLSGFEAREAERRKKEEVEREKKRIEREKNALFGDDSFVPVSAPVTTSTSANAVVKASGSVKEAITTADKATQVQQVKKSGQTTQIPAPAPGVKKAGGMLPISTTSPKPEVGKVVAQVKKAGGGAVGSGNKPAETKSSAVTTHVQAGASSYKPPPLPEVKYTAKTAASALPSLAAWRASGGANASSPASSASKQYGTSSLPSRRDASRDSSRNARSRGGRYESEEEEEDEEEEEEEEEDSEAARRERRRKKRKAEEMERMWAELRSITGYNPNDPKYRQRDRVSISEASYDDLQSEEKRSRNLGRKEDQEEEEIERRRAVEKKKRLAAWKRKNGYSDDEDDDSGDEDDY